MTVTEIAESLGRLPNESRRKWLARSAATVVGWVTMLAGGVLVTIPLTNRKLNLPFGWSDALLVAVGGAFVVAGVKITQLWNGRKN